MSAHTRDRMSCDRESPYHPAHRTPLLSKYQMSQDPGFISSIYPASGSTMPTPLISRSDHDKENARPTAYYAPPPQDHRIRRLPLANLTNRTAGRNVDNSLPSPPPISSLPAAARSDWPPEELLVADSRSSPNLVKSDFVRVPSIPHERAIPRVHYEADSLPIEDKDFEGIERATPPTDYFEPLQRPSTRMQSPYHPNTASMSLHDSSDATFDKKPASIPDSSSKSILQSLETKASATPAAESAAASLPWTAKDISALIEENRWLRSKNTDLAQSLQSARKQLELSNLDREKTMREIEQEYANRISLVQQELTQKLVQQKALIESNLNQEKATDAVHRLKSELDHVYSELRQSRKDYLSVSQSLKSLESELKRKEQDLESTKSFKKERNALQEALDELRAKHQALSSLYDQLQTKSKTGYSRSFLDDERLEQLRREHCAEIELLQEKHELDTRQTLKTLRDKWRQQAADKIQALKTKFTAAYEALSDEYQTLKTADKSSPDKAEETRKLIASFQSQIAALQEALKAERDLSQKQHDALVLKLENEWQKKMANSIEEAIAKSTEEVRTRFRESWNEKCHKLKISWASKKQELATQLSSRYEAIIQGLKNEFRDERERLLLQIRTLSISPSANHALGHRLELDSTTIESTDSLFSMSDLEDFGPSLVPTPPSASHRAHPHHHKMDLFHDKKASQATPRRPFYPGTPVSLRSK